MKFLHRRSTKGVAALATVFATAAFMVQFAMPSFAAVDAPDNVGSIFPVSGGPFDNEFTGVTQMDVLSGQTDLTAVSTAADTTVIAATQMSWYYCDSGSFPPNAAHCTLIGTDTTPTTPVETPGNTQTVDDAWSITWNIPAALTGDVMDIVAVGCDGAANATFTNCTQDIVPDVLLDGGGGPLPQTSTGVITAPLNGSGISSDTGVDPEVTATTSPELTAVAWGLDDCGVDATDPWGCDWVDENQSVIATTPDTTTATAKTWSGNLDSSSMDGNYESALTLFSTNADMDAVTAGTQAGGVVSAVCGDPCTSATVGGLAMDRIYVLTEPGTPGEAFTVQLRQTSDVTADPSCETGPTVISAPVGSPLSLTGCVFDAFGDPVASEGVFWTLSAAGTGFFTANPALTTDANGQAVASVSAPPSAVGTNTIVTFCEDHTNNGVCDTPSGDESFTASLTITWATALPTTHHRHVSLRLRDALTARGKVSVADGFGACKSNVPVKIQKRVSGHWKTIKRVTTSITGAYKAHLPNRHGKYRSLAPRVTKTGGMDICAKAVSPTRRH